MFASLAVIALIMALAPRLKAALGGSFLAKLGDASFGIYLCHMFAVVAFGKLLALVALPLALATVAKWVLAVGASYIFCLVVGKTLPRKVAGWIGC